MLSRAVWLVVLKYRSKVQQEKVAKAKAYGTPLLTNTQVSVFLFSVYVSSHELLEIVWTIETGIPIWMQDEGLIL